MMEYSLYKLVELFVDVAEANIMIMFASIFLAKDEIEKKRKIIFSSAIGMGLLCFLLDQIGLLSVWKMFLILFCYFCLLQYLYKQNVMKTIVIISIYSVLASAFEALIIFLVKYLSGEKLAVFFKWGIERTSVVVVIKVLETIVIIGLYFFVNPKQMKKIKLQKKSLKWLVILCVLISVLIFIFVLHQLTGKYESIIVITYSILTLGFVMAVIYAMIAITDRMDKQREMEWIQLHNSVLQQSLVETKDAYEHWEKSIHDYKNTILCLNEILATEDNLKIQEFLVQEMQQMKKNSPMVNTGNHMVDSILSVKWMEAERRKIYFSVQGKIFEQQPIEDVYWGRLLGNLIDNALEGAQKAKNSPFVEVELYQNEYILQIQVVNSSTKEKICFDISSKADASMHGVGLRSVQELVTEYNGTINIAQKDDIVECCVRIPIK